MKTNLDIKTLLSRLNKFKDLGYKHLVFGVTILVLVAYLFVVWKINQLATSEPSQEAQSTAELKTKIPKVDQKALQQIQSLEQSNSDIHSLFNSARNNPFQE